MEIKGVYMTQAQIELRKAQKQRNRVRRIARKRVYILDYLRSHACVDCGETDPIVLEFDHVRGEKRFRVSAMMVSWLSIDRMIEEISKCDIRCANCHRRKHSQDQFWYKREVA